MKYLSVRKLVSVIVSLLIIGFASQSDAQLSFSNPLLDFDSIICVARDCHTTEEHMCDQYFGCFAVPEGSIYIISGFKGSSRKVTDLLQNATVQGGRYAGKKLSGGSFISPDLSYDGKTVLFGWKQASTNYVPVWNQEQCFHIFKINIDGTGLVQLTDGSKNDFDPCWLPSGRIVFVSERRGGYGRCHGRPVPTYTLFSMKADGSDIIPLSYHETNEWHPSVDNNGMIVYSRWDYVDRDDCIAHHPWICYPDGRDPRCWHGNYPVPTTTMDGAGMVDGKWPDGRFLRPESELNVRAIPGSSKYVATATGHHTQSFGDLIMFDPNIQDDGKMSQITGITTKRTVWEDKTGPWATAWPLSEDYYLASYNGDIVFIDKSANRLTVCPKSATPAANLANFKLLDPIPVKSRPAPPNIPVQTFEGERATIPHAAASLNVANVYDGDMPLPSGTKIKWLRVIQLIPKATININEPSVCAASESVCRMALGIVPVESDGSANFEAPVDRCLMFQILDSNFMAVASMRSLTYVHKGEKLSCIGCHEDKWNAVTPSNPIAMKRAPSKLKTEFTEALPVSYYRTVKPVFDAKCAPCHKQKEKGPDMSYKSLEAYIFHFCDGGWPYTNGNISVAEIGGSRSIPGKVGAMRSKLYNYCKPSHYTPGLTTDEMHRITLWLDLNSNRLGSEVNVPAQESGQLVWPSIDVDPKNPLGLEDPTSPDSATSAIVTPTVTFVKKGGTAQFNAIGVNMANQKVEKQPTFSWSVSGGGTISQSGLFTAGDSEGGPYTVTATATIADQQQKFTATVTISTITADPLPAGNLTKLLCLQSSASTTCLQAADTASIESLYIGSEKSAPLPDDQTQINGSTFKWAEQTSQGGIWFSDCGENRTNYASITLINSKSRTFKIGYTQDDHITVWMNGQRVLSNRTWSTTEQLSTAISMPTGDVSFIIKHTNAGGAGSISLRFADSEGNDINDLLFYFKPAATNIQQITAASYTPTIPFTINTAGRNLRVNGKCNQMHRVEIFNACGQRVAFVKGTGNLHYSIPMNSNPAGMLVVRLEIDGRKYVQAIIVTSNR